MLLEHDRYNWHLPHDTAKSWKQLEQTLRGIAKKLRDWFRAASPPKHFLLHEPKFPSEYGYFSSHPTEVAARSGIRRSLDAFAVYFSYVSFLVALCQFTGKLNILDYYANQKSQLPDNVHPEFLNMFKKSHIVDFSGKRTRIGAIIDVLRCDWISVADVLLKAKVPIWLDWGDHPWMVTPRVGWMADYRPQWADLDQTSVTMPDPPPQPECPPSINEWSFNWLPSAPPHSQTESPPQLSALEVIARRRSPRDQLPGETYQQYFIRRQQRNEARMKTETAQDKQVRANREKSAAGRQYPGRKGPAVYYWESDSNGFRVRTLQTRAEAQKIWGTYSGPQKVFDSFANKWDCCTLF